MRSIRYLDFDLLIERGDQPGTYEARVIGAPSGEYEPVDFTTPFSDLELENFLLKIGRRRNIVRGLDTQDATTVREFGSQLFDRVFTGDLRLALATSLSETDSDDLGLRMRLRLNDCPELADIPWEYLYDKSARRFLALSEWTPVVRYLDLPGRVRKVTVSGPLRILGLASSPTDYPQLSIDDEWAKLRTSLDGLVGAGRVELKVVPDGTLASLHRELRRSDFHVFHYIGHGGFLPGGEDGVLILEDANGRGLEVSGQDLGVSLHDHRTLRLAMLNSCEGARVGITDPYAGTAQTLVHQGIPAVVAMQFEITDEAAITFSQVLYEAIADGYPLDAAMAEARKAVRNQPNPTEWGTPVLYLRSPDGHIFDIETSTQSSPPPEPPDAHDQPDAHREQDADSSESVEGGAGTDVDHEPVVDDDPGPDAQILLDRPRPLFVDEVPPQRTDDQPGRSRAQPQPIRRAPPPTAEPRTQPTAARAEPPGASPRGRARMLVIAAAVLAVVAAGIAAFLVLGRDDGDRTEPTYDVEELTAAQYPMFETSSCEPANAENAPVISRAPTASAIKCSSDTAAVDATFFCTTSIDDLDAVRTTYAETMEDDRQAGPVEVDPLGNVDETDGLERGYYNQRQEARVYWDSESTLCGAEVQARDTTTSVDYLVRFVNVGVV